MMILDSGLLFGGKGKDI